MQDSSFAKLLNKCLENAGSTGFKSWEDTVTHPSARIRPWTAPPGWGTNPGYWDRRRNLQVSATWDVEIKACTPSVTSSEIWDFCNPKSLLNILKPLRCTLYWHPFLKRNTLDHLGIAQKLRRTRHLAKLLGFFRIKLLLRVVPRIGFANPQMAEVHGATCWPWFGYNYVWICNHGSLHEFLNIMEALICR